MASSTTTAGSTAPPGTQGSARVASLPAIQTAQIEHFFAHYKDLEPGKWTKIKGWEGSAVARRMILEGIERAAKAG